MEEKNTVRKVKAKWVINVPELGRVLVKNGEEVKEGQQVVEVKINEEKVINLSSEFGSLTMNHWNQLREKLENQMIKEGELLFGDKPAFGKKPVASVSGRIVKTDEFRNIYVQSALEKIRRVVSPVDSKVSKIEKDSLVLEFKAEEYTGEGVTDGKVWGSGGLKFVEHLTDLSVRDSGRIILVDELVPAILIKAGVVGVKGVVVMDGGIKDNEKKVVAELPILKVDGDKFFTLRKFAVDENARVLLNASGGRLLLCQK